MLLILVISLSSANAATIHNANSLISFSDINNNAVLSPSLRQQSPLDGVLTGLFAPPFIVAVSMGALAHTMERFFKDVVKSSRGSLRRRKKKKPPQEPIKPFPPLQIAQPPPSPALPQPPPSPALAPPLSAPQEPAGAEAEGSTARYLWRLINFLFH